MRWTPFERSAQPQNSTSSSVSHLAPTGSWTAFILASIAACALIFSAAAQNIAHGWGLGFASSEFRAVVLAAASAGASLLGPFCWLAVTRGRGLGTRSAALLLALGCLAYAGVCSLGFTAGSRDQANSERAISVDAYADKRAVAEAARAELAQLASIKTPSRAVMERRRELAKILTAAPGGQSTAAPVKIDAQASALGFYARAAGWKVDDAAVGIWLSLGMTMFLELAAAWSLMVAAALRPVRHPRSQVSPVAAVSTVEPTIASALGKPATPQISRSSREAEKRGPDKDDDDRGDDPPAPPKPPKRGRGGRPRDVLPAQAIERLRAAGGRVNGSISGVGRLLGSRSKTSAHRLLHELAGAGLVRMSTSPGGCSVALAPAA